MKRGRQSANTASMVPILLAKLARVVRRRPAASLLSACLLGWSIYFSNIVHPWSWTAIWNLAHSALALNHKADTPPTGPPWLEQLGYWASPALYTLTLLLVLYGSHAMWVWQLYCRYWLPQVQEERFQGGCVLEVIIPTGSKADARAASDMLAQLYSLLNDLALGEANRRGFENRQAGKTRGERLALSLEMWSTPDTDGKVGFYIWCPTLGKNLPPGADMLQEHYRLAEEVRHLIIVHYPRCRVKWVDDPLSQALRKLTASHSHSAMPLSDGPSAAPTVNASGSANARVCWYELGLLADSRYPISSGTTSKRLVSTRPGSQSGAPGAGSDPLAAVLAMLGSDEDIPVVGVQIVIAARQDKSTKVQQALNSDLALLRELEARTGKKALGQEHHAEVSALEEKADRLGYETVVRLIAAGSEATPMSARKAEARLTSLARAFAQYDRTTAGVLQGLRVTRRQSALLGNPGDKADTVTSQGHGVSQQAWLRPVAPLIGRWPREGVSLPGTLPFVPQNKACVLNTAELSALYHFPHEGIESLGMLRWSNYKHIPPPTFARVTLADVARGERVMLSLLDDDIPPSYIKGFPQSPELPSKGPAFHTSSGPEVSPHMLGVGTNPKDLRRGTYVLGPMGSGKSVFLYNMISQYMRSGRGVGLIDGKGDSYEEVLHLVPQHLEGEVLTFDPENRRHGANSAGGRSIGINPLDGRVVARLGAEQVESMTMGLMKKMMGASWEQAVLMQRFLRDALLAVLEAEHAPTMLNLWRWLQDDGKGGNVYRECMLGKVRNQLVQNFWQAQVLSMNSQQRSSMQNVLTRVDRYIKNDVRHVILQPYSTVNFREIMDRGTIFVGRVSPRLGEDQSFLGALLLNGFLSGAFARQEIPQEQRRDYLLVVDEFQNFVDTARADVERMLSMARGYSLGLMLAHQFSEQLPREVLGAILKNVQTWVLFGLQADDARLFAGYTGLRPEDFQNLPPFYSYQRTVVGNRQTGVFSARPLPPPVATSNTYEHVSKHKEQSSPTYSDARDILHAALLPEDIIRLALRPGYEGEEAKRARILELARALYWPAEEGDTQVVQVLSTLVPGDMALYRRARSRVLDRRERARILANRDLVRDKTQRIERLSALRWGTPCVEVEALVRSMLREAGNDVGDIDAIAACTLSREGDIGLVPGYYGRPSA